MKKVYSKVKNDKNTFEKLHHDTILVVCSTKYSLVLVFYIIFYSHRVLKKFKMPIIFIKS